MKLLLILSRYRLTGTCLTAGKDYSMNQELVRQITVSDSGALKSFVTLEKKLLASYPFFVPASDNDTIGQLSGQTPVFKDIELTLFIVSNGEEDVARCAALVNRSYQEAKQEALGFIGYFAAAPDHELQVKAMLEQAEGWLNAREVTRIIAPHNGVFFGNVGSRTDAFDEEPIFPFNWDPPYYADYLESAGYKKSYPLWSYRVDFSSEKYRAVTRRASGNSGVLVRPINKKRWNEDIEIFRQILNQTFIEEWEFYPQGNKEFHEFFNSQKMIIDPRLILIAEIEGRPVGICLGYPNWNPLIRTFNGKFGLIQIIKFMLTKERYSSGGLVMIAVLPGNRGKGIAHSLAVTLYERYRERGLKEAEYHFVNEINTKSRRFAESMGGIGRVLYHCFDKNL